jgi:NitT/TauT family transport system substrate-binding protein
MKKNIFISVFVVLLLVALIAFIQSRHHAEMVSPNDRVSVRLPIPAADTGFAPLYLGMDKGFFKNAALEATLEPGSPELNPIKMVAQGTDQFGLIGGPELLFSARSKHLPVVGVALLGRNANLAGIITLKSSGLTKLDQLEGKTVGFYYGHITTDILHILFRKQNVHVIERDVGFDYSPLITNQVAGEWGFLTTGGITLPAKGIPINFINAADYGVVTQGYVVIANEKFVKDHSDVIQRFVDATIAATKYTLDHPDDAIEATIKRDPQFRHEVGEKQVPLYATAIRNNPQIGSFTQEDINTTIAQMKSADLLPADFDSTGGFDSRFVDAYYRNATSAK